MRAHGDERAVGEAFRQKRRWEDDKDELWRDVQRKEQRRQRHEYDQWQRDKHRQQAHDKLIREDGSYREPFDRRY